MLKNVGSGLSSAELIEMAYPNNHISPGAQSPHSYLVSSKIQMPHGDDMIKNQMTEPPSSDRNNRPKIQDIDDNMKREITAAMEAEEGIELEIDQKAQTNTQSGQQLEEHDKQSQNHHRAHKHSCHQNEGFDSLKIPADWKKAELHAQSRETKPELDEASSDGGMQPVCECCGYELERKKVGLNVDIMDLGFLGSGFPLFYNYIKYCCLMLFSLFVIQGIPNLVYNLKGDFCNKTELEVYEAHEENKHHPVHDFIIPCPDSVFNRMSIANVIDKMDHKTNYDFHYSIAAILAQLALSMLFRRSQRQIESKVDEDNSTPSDFTIMVENIKTDLPDTEASLRSIMEKYGTVTKINLVYDINQLEEIEHKMDKVIKEKQDALYKGNFNFENEEVKKADAKIEEVEKEEHSVMEEIKKSKFVGTAFISFETEQQKKNAIEGNPQNGYRRFKSFFSGGVSEKYNESIYMEDRHLYVSEAPEPNDVDWEFAHVLTPTKIRSRFSSFCKFAILSIVSFAVICAISYFQSHETDKNLEKQFELEAESASGERLLLIQAGLNATFNTNILHQTDKFGLNSTSFASSNFTETLNSNISSQYPKPFLRRMSGSSGGSTSGESSGSEHSSDHSSKQDEIDQEKILITALSFIISALIVIWNKFALPQIVHKISDHEKWSTKTNMNISFAFKLTLGLFFNTALITFFVEIIFFQNVYGFAGGMIYNEFLVFLFNAVVPSVAWIVDPWKIIQDCKRRRERKKPQSALTQAQANSLMENPSYSMGKRYADIMKTMWFTFFYSPIMPIGTIISLLGLIAYYFTDKYNLLFRRTVKESIGSSLSFEMVELVEYSMIFHTFGQVFFKYFVSYYVDVGNFFMFIAVCIIVILVPMQKVNELIFPLSSSDDAQTYSQVVNTFDTDYDRENPITKKKAILLFQELRKSQNNEKALSSSDAPKHAD